MTGSKIAVAFLVFALAPEEKEEDAEDQEAS